jgi:hypothetical protein
MLPSYLPAGKALEIKVGLLPTCARVDELYASTGN